MKLSCGSSEAETFTGAVIEFGGDFVEPSRAVERQISDLREVLAKQAEGSTGEAGRWCPAGATLPGNGHRGVERKSGRLSSLVRNATSLPWPQVSERRRTSGDFGDLGNHASAIVAAVRSLGICIGTTKPVTISTWLAIAELVALPPRIKPLSQWPGIAR